ncbi:hypothetical protein KQY27_02780 [Methanobrevibacter sp. TMH8]|uniref:hypothetical protein n=1 Tax=Methanobrevibacter sp. TMH8 TaxID=2848611 RepID=UPI001CCBABED|nr:hypothetical protein [Methanobrevibacter sp. TMH8]MBZ9570470.1 hypothetical protein [Methanobrevibacter sp. TMH8]
MKEEVGNGKVINVMENYNLSNIIVDGKFFTALLNQKEDLSKIKDLGTFDVKLNNGRMLFDCKIDNETSEGNRIIIRGYFTKFE